MIKVIIERRVAPELGEFYDRLSRETLQKAMLAPGFISGETLCDLADANHRLILATFRSAADWYHWYRSDEREEMMEALSPLLDGEEKVTLFEH